MQDGTSEEKKPRVLIVEDEPVMNELVAEILRFNGFDVRGVFNGEDALECCRHELPDAVVLDLMLPGISGYEVCHQLKCARATNLVPVIMLTALDRHDDRVRGIRVGADAYVTKPFEPELLIDQIMEALARARSRAAQGVRGQMVVSFESGLDYLNQVNDLLRELFAQTQLGEDEIQQIQYCLLEIGKKAAEWARKTGQELVVNIEYTLTDSELVFRIREGGAGHATPGAQGPPAQSFVREKLGLEEGNFDILLSQKFMDDICWAPDGSEVTLLKRLKKA